MVIGFLTRLGTMWPRRFTHSSTVVQYPVCAPEVKFLIRESIFQFDDDWDVAFDDIIDPEDIAPKSKPSKIRNPRDDLFSPTTPKTKPSKIRNTRDDLFSPTTTNTESWSIIQGVGVNTTLNTNNLG